MNKKAHGFTIAEMIIIIVVIGILAAIVAAIYNNITKRTVETTTQSDLSQASKLLAVDRTQNGAYPSTSEQANRGKGLKASGQNEFQYTSDGTGFCLTVTSNRSGINSSFHVSDSSGSPTTGVCSSHIDPSAPFPTTMQAFKAGHCNTLSMYTGTNAEAIKPLTDTRDGKTYRVAKLADNRCWMLDNLKLGSTTGSMTLTSSDSDVLSNFVLPQVRSGGSANYDTPTASGSVSGDTGGGSTNYGYLYNWPAATAGETRTTITDGDASHSICAKGWRLPTGGATGEFAMLNAKMNNPNATNPSTNGGSGYYQNWQHSGPLKTVFAGDWWQGFYGQGSYGNLWSSSSDWPDVASIVEFWSNGVGFRDDLWRSTGFGVRCIVD